MRREEILAEIRRTTKENGGRPLGIARFEQATSIKPYDWSKYWPRFSDAQREAGFEANKLVASFSDEHLLDKLLAYTRELGHLPTQNELRMKRHADPSYPSKDVFRRLGSKSVIVRRLLQRCKEDPQYSDVAVLLEPLVSSNVAEADSENPTTIERYGFVYLVRGHPGEYKVGRTNLVDRRLSELGATASIEQVLLHEIKTDDPAGVESYWHKRFAEKRMRGEWFKLNAEDVQAFKRWRRLY